MQSQPAQIQFLASHPGSQFPPVDFNQDGRADLVWQHGGDGWIAAWLLDGERVSDSVLMTPNRVSDTNWKIEGVGDFNADGKPDLLWRHSTDGWLAVWYMDGTKLLSSVSLSPSRVADPNWRVAAVADFDDDGRPDLVWQDTRHGWVVIWLMNGVELKKSLDPSVNRVPDTGWRIVGAGDMNGDGAPDILWQHSSQGWLAAWLMNGLAVADSVLLTPSRVTDPLWDVVALADFNGDGHLDLVWQERSKGWVGIWLMKGLALSTSMALNPDRVADTKWRIVGAR